MLILQCQGIHSQGRLNTIIGSREKQCTGAPTNNFQEYKCKQQNQCLNIKKHAVQQRLINTNGFFFNFHYNKNVLYLVPRQGSPTSEPMVI